MPEGLGPILGLGQERRQAILTKVLSRVSREPSPGLSSPCWVWTGPTSGGTGRGSGYGRMSLNGATVAVHRAVFEVVFGPIPPRKHIDHLCRNRLCVNPEHLEMVTHKKNCKRRDEAALTKL